MWLYAYKLCLWIQFKEYPWHTHLFAGTALCQIFPSGMLTITDSESGTLSCTAPCQNCNGHDIKHFHFNDQNGFGVRYDDNSILSISDAPMQTDTDCTYLLNISWTMDDQIRRELDSIQCTFLYHDFSSNCITGRVNIKFRDIGKKLRNLYNNCPVIHS